VPPGIVLGRTGLPPIALNVLGLAVPLAAVELSGDRATEDGHAASSSFIAPFFLLFVVFGLYPIVYSLWLSFLKGFGFGAKTFVGLANYAHLVQDDRYLRAVLNTT
jgi:hypothetical protein